MAEVDTSVLVAHVGLTTKGAIGAQTAMSLDDSVKLVQEIHDVGKSVNENIIVLCHGASSIERLPTANAIPDHMKKFKRVPIGEK